MSAAIENMEIAADALIVLHRMAASLAECRSAQHIHQYEGAGQYRVRHVREGCDLCDDLETIAAALNAYRAFARKTAEVDGLKQAHRQPALEGER